jgi:CheY-like chemotaxis protein
MQLNDAVGVSERMLRRVIGEDVHLELELCRSGGPIVGDPSRIEQVLLNLAVNARDAMPSGGRLRIATRDLELTKPLQVRSGAAGPGCYVVLEVEDTGAGMDAHVRQHAFEPFFTTKPAGTGTGLGLYTVYNIVGQLGGAVDLASSLGHGTRLTLYFPRVEAAAAGRAEPKPGAPAASARQRGGTVLIVEDERLIRVTLRHLLSKLGFRVLVAEDGEEALEVARSHGGPIDLLLSDIVLPRSSGPEVAAALTAQREGLKVLFMSAYPAHVLVEQGRVPAGTRTLEKPFEERRLVEALEEALGAA